MNWPERLARPCLNPLQDGDPSAIKMSADLSSLLLLNDCVTLSLRLALLVNESQI